MRHIFDGGVSVVRERVTTLNRSVLGRSVRQLHVSVDIPHVQQLSGKNVRKRQQIKMPCCGLFTRVLIPTRTIQTAMVNTELFQVRSYRKHISLLFVTRQTRPFRDDKGENDTYMKERISLSKENSRNDDTSSNQVYLLFSY